jgi:hypothetical protein
MDSLARARFIGRRWQSESAAWPAREIESQALTGAGYACSARPDLDTVCRSFPKISSVLSAKVCGGSKKSRVLPETTGVPTGVPFDGARRGSVQVGSGVVQRGPHARSSCRRCTPSAAHFLKSHQLLVRKFAVDRKKGASPREPRPTVPFDA